MTARESLITAKEGSCFHSWLVLPTETTRFFQSPVDDAADASEEGGRPPTTATQVSPWTAVLFGRALRARPPRTPPSSLPRAPGSGARDALAPPCRRGREAPCSGIPAAAATPARSTTGRGCRGRAPARPRAAPAPSSARTGPPRRLRPRLQVGREGLRARTEVRSQRVQGGLRHGRLAEWAAVAAGEGGQWGTGAGIRCTSLQRPALYSLARATHGAQGGGGRLPTPGWRAACASTPRTRRGGP